MERAEMNSIKRLSALVPLGLLAVFGTHESAADFVAYPADQVIAHPVSTRQIDRTGYQWKKTSGEWGESFATQNLKLDGFNEIVEVKNPSDNGIDRVALKRDRYGRIQDVRFVEVKTHRGSGPAKPAKTTIGDQLSRKWLADRLRNMRASGDPRTKRLATEISRFRIESNRSAASLCELHDINTRTGKYTIRDPGTLTVRREFNIDSRLEQIIDNPKGPEAAGWARNTLENLHGIRSTKESDWINTKPSSSFPKSTSSPSVKGFGGTAKGKVLSKFAGPAGLVVAIGMDAKDVYDEWAAYSMGLISREQFHRNVSRLGGGIAGAAAGSYIGAQVGLLGGPFAFITVPAGAALGGVAGYFVGSDLGGYGAEMWYSAMDEEVQEEYERWLSSALFPY